MEDSIPLSPEDRAILALECATVAGHTCKVVRLGADALDIDRLRARVTQRLALAPALTRRLGGSAASPAWVSDERFEIANHIRPAPTPGPVDRAELPALVAQLFEQRLDRTRPLWRIEVVELADGGSALVWLIHHSLADGTACVRYARALLWDDGPEARMTAVQARAAHSGDEARRRAHLAGFVRREYASTEHRSPFDGSIGTHREVAFAAVPLAGLHEAAKVLDGATVNDAILTIVAGALGRWMRARHGHLGSIRVRVPVSLHHEGDTVANHDSFFSVGLPLNEPNPLARLHAVHAATRERKSAHDAEHREALLRELGGVSPPLEHFLERLENSPRRFALSVSNVPGPPTPVSVLGVPVERLHSLAEIGERHALRVSALSFAGMLCFGLCADPELVDRLELMADAFEEEAQALFAAAGIL
jgi:diacylglycerol O-acyltransferase / wax synthase